MKRRSVVRAYEPVRPDEEAKVRMLRNIQRSSEISPAGKDEPMKVRKIFRHTLVAALIMVLIGTVAVADELLRVPLKETGAFTSNDGTVEFYLDIDEEVLGEVIPSVDVVPHFFTGDDAKQVATVLFGDTQLYEEESYDSVKYSQDEIRSKIERWEQYASKEALRQLFPKKANEDDYIEEALRVVNKFIDDYNNLYEDAPIENPREPCRWTLRSSIEYMYPEEEWVEHATNDVNEEISATLKYNGIPYHFTASQRDNETFRVNNISVCITDGISPFGIDERIFKAELCRTTEPTEEQILAVKVKAEEWLSRMELGNWMIDECYVETYSSGESTEYYIHVNAVPVFYGIPAIRREQITSLRGREEGKTYYYYTDVNFEFSPNGELLLFRMYSPVDIEDSNYNEEMLTIDQLMEIAKEDLISSSASSYSYIPTAYENVVDIGCRICVTDVDYSLTRTTDVDNRKPFVYSLGVSLSGSVEYYDKTTGETIDFEEDRILLVLDGKDGTFVGRG